MCQVSAGWRSCAIIADICGWYSINILVPSRLAHFWVRVQKFLYSLFKIKSLTWKCRAVRKFLVIVHDHHKCVVDIGVAESGGRLVGWWVSTLASVSQPAMGCGGSKAQPTSEVTRNGCYFHVFSIFAFYFYDLNLYVWVWTCKCSIAIKSIFFFVSLELSCSNFEYISVCGFRFLSRKKILDLFLLGKALNPTRGLMRVGG